MSRFETFEVKLIGPVTLVRPLDDHLVQRDRISLFSDEFLEYVAQEKPEMVVYTLKQVTRYSSEAIGGLIRVHRKILEHGGEIKLCMKDTERELFKVARLDGNVFSIYPTESDAIAAFFEHGGDIF